MVNHNKTLHMPMNFISNYRLELSGELSANFICMHSQLIEWNGCWLPAVAPQNLLGQILLL